MAEPRPAPGYEQSTCDVEGYRYAPALVQPTVPTVSGYPDPAYPTPSYAICDDGFKEIVSSMSGWYDRHRYINKLKVLYRDLITEPDKLYAATKVNELFELLCTFGHLSPEDSKVLYDTINVTKPFGLEPEIRMLSINVPDIRTVFISKFTQSRQNLIKVIESLTDNVVKKISKLYSCDKKSDKWEFVLDLEQRGKICEENMDNFMRNITTHLIIDLNADPLRLRRTGKHNMGFVTREPCLNTLTDTGDTLTGDTDAGQSTLTADGQGEIMMTSDRLIGDTHTGDTLTGVTDSGQSTSTEQLAVTRAVERAMQTYQRSTDNVCIVNNMFQGNNGSTIGCQLNNPSITDFKSVNNIFQIFSTQGIESSPSKTHHQQPSEDEVIKKYLLKSQQQLCCDATLFTPANLNTRYEVDIAHMFTDLDLIKESKKKQDIKPTTLEEVLSIIKSTTACKVLIEGEGGIGKSTLLRYIAYNWAKDESDETFKGKILFLVKISSIDKDETILDAIVKQINLEDFQLETYLSPDSMLIKRFIRNHNTEIVLLLDGLDELKDGSESPISYFKRKQMNSSKVIVTSRSENIDEFIKASDIHVKVKGFSKANIEKYIKKHFEFFEKPVLGDSLIRELNHNLRKHLEVNSLCKNPMLLLLMCTMWEESQQLPDNKSDLFKQIFRCILNQYIDKQETNKEKISKYEDIPKGFINAMVLLGKCMYKSLKRNQLSIKKTKLEGNYEMVTLALKLGFVYKDAPNLKSDFEEIFTAPHKLIVESLVGFYLCKLCQAAQFESECSEDKKSLLQSLDDNEWKFIRESKHLNTAKEFAIGFLGADAGTFLNHWITNSLSTYRSLMAHFKSVKVEHMTNVKKTLIHCMKNLEIMHYINEICKSLRKLFNHVISNEDIESEHFIDIMQRLYWISIESSDEINWRTCINKYFSKEMSSEERGKMIAHTLIAVSDQSYFLDIVSRICGDDDIKYLTTECQKLNFKYDITHLNLCNTNTASYIVHLLSNTPQLKRLKCSCITGAIMNAVMRECSSRGLKLELNYLDISGNDLRDIDGSSLTSLLVIALTLSNLNMSNCSLSGVIMNDVIRECCSRKVKLELRKLNISGNNLRNIDGSSLACLFVITPKLEILRMSNCSLSGVIMNDMRDCCSRGVKLELKELNISGNNLSNIDASSLVSLFTPKLEILMISNCSLSGAVVNNMMKDCCIRGLKLEIKELNISSNNLSNINGSSLVSLFITPKLRILRMSNCSLSGAVMNDVMTECCSRGIKLELWELNISGNNLSNIDISSLTSLFITPKFGIFRMSNCSLSGAVMKDTMIQTCIRGVKLQLWELNISGNNLSKIDGSSLVSLFITPKLGILRMSNCSLSGAIMNEMMKDCCNRGLKIDLWELNISGNNLSNIDGSLLVSLFITPKLGILRMSNCSLSGAIINDITREVCSRGVKLKIKELNISCNNLSNIDIILFMSLFITPTLGILRMSNCSLPVAFLHDVMRECYSNGVKFESESVVVEE